MNLDKTVLLHKIVHTKLLIICYESPRKKVQNKNLLKLGILIDVQEQ